jgi:hypothetical protein
MPFDNAPERAPSEELSLYERLKILRELVPKNGNQGSWSANRRPPTSIALNLTLPMTVCR